MRASRLALDNGVYYAHFLILGGYGDTREHVRETIENSRRLEYTVMFPYAGMRIYPHTRLAELAAREGVIGPDDDLLAPAYYIAPDFRRDGQGVGFPRRPAERAGRYAAAETK